ncbi:MAG: isoamylase [Chthoniobacter sp.]|jgi:glycogen operon protein|nr:isoamylase [Chthoniobacter sp.]
MNTPSRRATILRCIACAFLGLLTTGHLFAVGPNGLGATYDATQENITFRVFSSSATRIEVWVYDQPLGAAEKARYELTAGPAATDPAIKVWTKTVPGDELKSKGVTGTVYYGYRAWGPNWTFDASWTPGSLAGRQADVDDDGQRFNPNKLLIDPYALEVSHDPVNAKQTDGDIYSSARTNVDTGAQAPKGIVLKPGAPNFGTKPTRPFRDEIIYEVHLRGLTKNDPSVPEAERGTYAGAGRKAAYLKEVGVTAVEFLPVQEVQNDQNDLQQSTNGDNYWGYDPIAYFAPDRRYAVDQSPGGPTKEFTAMAAAFHAQGIKVYIDVVYNHTAEGHSFANGQHSRLLSLRGLDNPVYYELAADPRFYRNSSGVAPNLNTATEPVRNLIVDSLAYWKDTLGVDGFRFDLAPVIGNICERTCFNYNKFAPKSALNRLVRELPVRDANGGAGCELIAEPWTLESYQMGDFPSGWAEWNDKYRDTVRSVQNKLGLAPIPPGEMAARFAGSSDKFQDDGRKPWNSVNFIVAHDGFCLRDLYAFNGKKNNQPWPFGPSDGGSDNNLSWDQGGNPDLQRQAARTGLAILMFSAGVPMITGGDEMYRTQFGNNNVYNLDSDKNYLDYADATRFPHFFNYSKKLFAFRSAHPALRRKEFFTGQDKNHNGLKDIIWLTTAGQEADPGYMSNPDNHFLGFRIDGTEEGDSVSSIYVAYNGWSEKLPVHLPVNLGGKQWFRVCDTAAWMEGRDNFVAPGAEEPMASGDYEVNGRSILVLVER